MSKDEYLITDTPLKALTVFAMPMILGSFFQQIYNMADSIIVGQFVGSSALAAVAAVDQCHLCGTGLCVGAGMLLSPNISVPGNMEMKSHRQRPLFSFFNSKHSPWCFWLLLFPFDDEDITNPVDILNDAVLYLRVYFCGLSISVYVTFFPTCSLPLVNQNPTGTLGILVNLKYF